ncbi:MAG: transport permease protein [Gammaproteobacteria bacterium]|nr:MAG: transport permease protein [Gammaproteobacteria bacterium]
MNDGWRLRLQRIGAIVYKELRQLRRDRLTFGMIAGIPLIQILLFGYAINTDVRGLAAGVVDLAGTQLSRRLVADAEASQVLGEVVRLPDPAALEAALRRGELRLGLIIPADFERRLAEADPARPAVQLLIDGTDPIVGNAARALGELWAEGGRRVFAILTRFNPERRSSVFVVPGLIGVILTMTMVLFTAVAIVRERERGNLEFLITTPVAAAELMVGKVLPYIGIGLIQVTLVLALAVALFHVPVNGSLLDLYLAAGMFILANLTLGLFISTVAQSQFQAMQMTFFFFLPSVLLSGFMFTFEAMPAAARHLAELLPLTHFVRLSRGILLRGAGLAELWPELAALAGFAAALLGLALLRFRKRL